MKKPVDIKTMLFNKVADKLIQLFKADDPMFSSIMRYFLSCGLGWRDNSKDNVLAQIKTDFAINNYKDLVALLKKISIQVDVAKFKAVVGQLFIELFEVNIVSVSFMETLLLSLPELSRLAYSNSELKVILDYLIVGIYGDAEVRSIFINYFQLLLKEVNADNSKIYKLRRICDALPDADFIVEAVTQSESAGKLDLRLLMEILLREEDTATYLRGQNFPDLVIAAFGKKDSEKINNAEFKEKLNDMLSFVIRNVGHNFTVEEAGKNDYYRQMIAKKNQEFIDWILAKQLNDIVTPQLLVICQCIANDMINNHHKSEDDVLIYLGGVIFLRLICPAITSYGSTNENSAKSPLFKAEIINITKMLQNLANKTGDKKQSQLWPEQAQLLKSGVAQSGVTNASKIKQFLRQFLIGMPSLVNVPASASRSLPLLLPIVRDDKSDISSSSVPSERDSAVDLDLNAVTTSSVVIEPIASRKNSNESATNTESSNSKATKPAAAQQQLSVVVQNELIVKLPNQPPMLDDLTGMKNATDLILNVWYETCVEKYDQIKDNEKESNEGESYSILDMQGGLPATLAGVGGVLMPKISLAINTVMNYINLQDDLMKFISRVNVRIFKCEQIIISHAEEQTSQLKSVVPKEYRNWQDLDAGLIIDRQNLDQIDTSDTKITEAVNKIAQLKMSISEVQAAFDANTTEIRKWTAATQLLISQMHEQQAVIKDPEKTREAKEQAQSALTQKIADIDLSQKRFGGVNDAKTTLLHQQKASEYLKNLLVCAQVDLTRLQLLKFKKELVNLAEECSRRKLHEDQHNSSMMQPRVAQ